MQIDYEGDGQLNRIVSWFKGRVHSINICLENGLLEEGLVLIYSGIDTLGFLSAPPDVSGANRHTFLSWCDKYFLQYVRSAENESVSAFDIYAARCGMLHTSMPITELERKGKAHQVWYRFKDTAGANFMMATPQRPMGLDIENLAVAFKFSGIMFIEEINQDRSGFQIADDRAQNILRWGRLIP